MAIPFAQMSFPEMYEHSLVGPLFRPWAEQMVEAMELAAGERVLDIACGTGIVARLAKQRVGDRGRVTGVDASPGMLAVARRIAPAVDWREGDAAALPLGYEEAFDVVFCQQGLQFFPDRPAAVREMHRALVPEGRLAVSTWRPDEEIPLFFALRRVAEGKVGPIQDRRHGFGDGALLGALLRDAGFEDVRCRTVTRRIRFDDGTAFLRLNAMALVGMSAASKTLGEEQRERIVEEIARGSEGALGPYRQGKALTFELGANLATARR
jgi:SAM-dependent methyltransferase